jgi:glycosyltransferase involved in cell wall biosynthesis
MMMCERVYAAARLLFVHSGTVRAEFATIFPAYVAKLSTMSHGTYTLYPRNPGARARVRAALEIPDDAIVLLCCGAIRPYKNIGACVRALAQIHRRDVVLVIAGAEPESSPIDPLAETRALVHRAGVVDRVRLRPGFLDEIAMADLFEAVDILMLPYLKSYGSGLLMLGVTFGKYIIATRSGMEDSAVRYPGSILLRGTTVDDVRIGIEIALQRISDGPRSIERIPPEFEWANIAKQCLSDIERVVPHS